MVTGMETLEAVKLMSTEREGGRGEREREKRKEKVTPSQ
jgi:hypothetical protein